jgi:hypothetical protein
MKSIFGSSLFALCLMATSASAAAIVPKVVGTYGISVYTECASKPQATGMGVGTMAFSGAAASTANVSLNYRWFDRNPDGTILQETRSVSGQLKLTGTTFTITPTGKPSGPSGPMTFGALDAKGVAHTLSFLWTDYDPGYKVWCLHTLNATQQ